MVTIQLGKNDYPLEKPRLKRWLELEEIKRKILEATEKEDAQSFLDEYYSLISVASSASVDSLYDLPWIELAIAYTQIINLQLPEYDFPMLMVKSKHKLDDWDYEGRTWYIWLHLFAGAYHWNIEYIENLEINDAIALMHEIVSDDFHKREWEYGLSDISYSIDPTTKQGKYKPLPKPEWMQIRTKVQELPKVKILKSMMPSGIVVRYNEQSHDKQPKST